MVSGFLTDDHRACDDLFAQAEAAAGEGDIAGARSAYVEFEEAMELHLSREETVLFPEFEQLTGMQGGPTAIMRMEHQQMRGLMAQMGDALASGSVDDFLGLAETLNILVQQHNIKEQEMLYPMCDEVLGTGGAALITRMQAAVPG